MKMHGPGKISFNYSVWKKKSFLFVKSVSLEALYPDTLWGTLNATEE
jgi:hypothetical protein